MIGSVNDYRKIVGDEQIDSLVEISKSLTGKCVEHVNSTYYGGGVAEILNKLVLLMNDLGIQTGWRLFKGHVDFFTVTKSFHNALQSADIKLTEKKKRVYMENNELNSIIMHIQDHDFIMVHDPQPLPLINFYKKNNTKKWIWRCHIDLTNPNQELWNYLKNFILKYDAMVVSIDKYKKDDITIPQNVIAPSIDPLSDKNTRMDKEKAKKILSKYGISEDKPIISQVSRFDPWKDPLGVMDAYSIIKKEVDCQLVFMANMASDDPEGPKIYGKVVNQAKKDENIKLLVNIEDNDRVVNALQTASSVVIQKSIREGFGLTVSEALWKGTPVVGGNCGGIPLQIIDGKTGYLVNNSKECADRVLKLLKDPDMAKRMGEQAKQHVKENFLITRHLRDYINLMISLM